MRNRMCKGLVWFLPVLALFLLSAPAALAQYDTDAPIDRGGMDESPSMDTGGMDESPSMDEGGMDDTYPVDSGSMEKPPEEGMDRTSPAGEDESAPVRDSAEPK
jgi:hypothetical protein